MHIRQPGGGVVNYIRDSRIFSVLFNIQHAVFIFNHILNVILDK